jgi:hypothetical protein
MASLHDPLKREEERFRLLPDALERFHSRRLRRQRNRRVVSGAVALSIAAVGTWIAYRALDTGEGQQPRPASVTTVAKLAGEPSAIATGEGQVWVTVEDGLIRTDAITGETARFGLPRELGQPISVQVAEGSVWVQTASIGQEFSTLPGHPRITPAAITRISPATGSVLSSFDLRSSEVIPVSVGGGAIWSVSTDGLVIRRDIEDGRVTATGRVEAVPVQVSFGEGWVWVLSRTGLQRVDPEQVAVTAKIGLAEGKDLAVGAEGVWVLDEQGPTLLHIEPETASIAETIPLPGAPDRVSAGSAGVWVLDRDEGTLLGVESGTVALSAKVEPDAVDLTQVVGTVRVALSDGSILEIRA